MDKEELRKNILIIDNALSVEDFKLCEDVIYKENRVVKMLIEEDKFRSYTRWLPRSGSIIPRLMEKVIWSEKVHNAAKPLCDLAWKDLIMKYILNYEVHVTTYSKQKDHYKWHIDNERRSLNYIFYLTDCEGGFLQVSDYTDHDGEPWPNESFSVGLSVKPKRNRMVIMPSWYIHRVTPLISGERVTVNGHVSR